EWKKINKTEHGTVHSMESLEYAQHFSVKDTDVFVVTYPRSGGILSLYSKL
uniref:Sulfotransferase n=1 Tax=Monopterus albus TaxID=43700 RepID=A0A3Q3IN87_MONAL